jgi:hypothetical protein
MIKKRFQLHAIIKIAWLVSTTFAYGMLISVCFYFRRNVQLDMISGVLIWFHLYIKSWRRYALICNIYNEIFSYVYSFYFEESNRQHFENEMIPFKATSKIKSMHDNTQNTKFMYKRIIFI